MVKPSAIQRLPLRVLPDNDCRFFGNVHDEPGAWKRTSVLSAAKGVALGVICTVTVLPALIMTFRKTIERHTHGHYSQTSPHSPVCHAVQYCGAFGIPMVLFIPFSVAQSKTSVYYTLFDTCRRIWTES